MKKNRKKLTLIISSNIIALIALVSFSIACGGSGGGSLISNVAIYGEVDYASAPAGPYDGDSAEPYPANTSATFAYLGGPTAGNINIQLTKTFQAFVNARTDVILSFNVSNRTILTRAVPSSETSTVQTTANVNMISTLIATVAINLVQTQGISLQEAIALANQMLLGTETPAENNGITLGAMSAYDSNLAADAQILGVLMNSLSTGAGDTVYSVYQKLLVAFQQNSLVGIKAAFITAVNGLESTDEIDAFASAYSTAYNAGDVATASFTDSLYPNLDSNIQSAIDQEKASPTFSGGGDSIRIAAPGILFKYSFPTASTTDILGITGYSGAFEGSSPNGPTDATEDNGRTVKFIPDENDVGQTYTYHTTAFGGNGKTATRSVSFTVTTSRLEASHEILIGYSSDASYLPTLGPVTYNDDVYLIATIGAAYRLERYEGATLNTSSTNQMEPTDTWTLPTAQEPNDFTVDNGRIYIAQGNQNIIAYNIEYTTASNTPDFEFNYSPAARYIGYMEDTIYARTTDAQHFSSPSDLSGRTLLQTFQTYHGTLPNAATPGTYAMNTTGNTYLALSSTNSVYMYNINSNQSLSSPLILGSGNNNLLTLPDVNALNHNLIHATNSDMATSSYPIYKIEPGASSITTTSISGSSNFQMIIANGTYGFGINSTNTWAFSLSASSNEIIDDLNVDNQLRLHYDNAPGTLTTGIANALNGVGGGNSGAYIYTIGQTTTVSGATAPDTWSIKVHTFRANAE